MKILKLKFTDGGLLESLDRKISITFYSSSQNSKKSVYNRLPAKPLKYSNFWDIFADVWPILMKFCTITHIRYPEHNSCSKSEMSKNSTEWTLPFKKNCQMRYLSYCFTDFDEIWCHDAYYPLQLQFQVCAFIEGYHHRIVPFPSILHPKTAKKAQITVCMLNQWNTQTCTIS